MYAYFDGEKWVENLSKDNIQQLVTSGVINRETKIRLSDREETIAEKINGLAWADIDGPRAHNANSVLAATYFNCGNVKYLLADDAGAIEDYTKAIELEPEYVVAYYNRGSARENLGDYAGAIEDYLTCLYVSLKNKIIEFIPNLLYQLKDYPQNIATVFETFELDYSNVFILSESCSSIKDFDLLLGYYRNNGQHSLKEMLHIEAMLFYYLGGNVPAFRIYDEKLDCDSAQLSAQEIFYYVKTAMEINWEAQAIFEDGIKNLKQQAMTDEDFYYLGHLHLMNGEKTDAIDCFQKSKTFSFSNFMWNELQNKETDIQTMLELLATEGEIDTTSQFSDFQDYFHLRECLDALSFEKTNSWNFEDVYPKKFWEAFRICDSFSKDLEITQRRIEADAIKEELISRTENLRQEFHASGQKVEELEDYTDPSTHLSLLTILHNLEMPHYSEKKIERDISTLIYKKGEYPTLIHKGGILLLIRRAYLMGKISAITNLNLVCYLDYIDETFVQALALLMKISVPTPISSILGFVKTTLVSKLIKDQYEKNEKFDYGYDDFKKCLWVSILQDRDTLTQDKFDKKYLGIIKSSD